MQTLKKQITAALDNLPESYQKKVYDFIAFLVTKSSLGNDTDYINSIPGLTEAIIKASKTPLKKCIKKLDWEDV